MSSIDTSYENEIKSLNNTILNMISNRFKLLWVNLPLLCFPFQLRSSVTNVQFIQCFYSCMIFELDKQVDDLRRNIWMEAEDVAYSLLHDVGPILQLGSLSMQGVKTMVTLSHMEHRLLGRRSQTSVASQGNKFPVLELSRFKVKLKLSSSYV